MSSESQVWLTVLFFFLSILIATGCREMKKSLKIPVTLSIMICGFLFRVLGNYFGNLGSVVDFVKSIEQTVFQYAAFPMIIFQGALSKVWYTMRKELIQISILASTHLVLTSVFNALVLKYVLDYQFDWSDLLLLGVILSSTDNFAIDSILEEVVLPHDLETLMSGETMFNEAAVFVLFTVLYNSSGSALNIAEAFGIATRLTLGGLCLGVFYGVVIGLMFRRMKDDIFLVMNTLLVAVYSLYFLSEGTVVRFSGGFALVALGLYLSAYGKTLISLDILDQVNNILNIIARNSESVVFLISGILIADISIYEADGLEPKDYLSLAVVFISCHLTRALSLLIHSPLLRYFGPKFNWKEFIVLSLAGVKGIFSTTLALVVFTSETLNDHRFQNVSAFLAIGSAGLTVATGGFIIKLVTRLLGFEKMDELQENLLLGVAKAISEVSEEKIKELQADKNLGLVNWDYLMLNFGPRSLIKSILKGSKASSEVDLNNSQLNPLIIISEHSEKVPLSSHLLIIEMRRRYLNALKGMYWESYQKGYCNGKTFLVLTDSCNISLDISFRQMADWDIVLSSVYSPKKILYFSKFSRLPLLGSIFKKSTYKSIFLACDAAQTFIKCHRLAEELLDKLEIDIDKNSFDAIIQEAAVQSEHARNFLNAYILDCYPEILSETQTKRSCKRILCRQKIAVNRVFEQGLIKDNEYETLKHSIESSIRDIVLNSYPSLPTLKEVLVNRFPCADLEEIKLLVDKIQQIEVHPDEIVFKESEEVKGAFLIIRGRAFEYSSWVSQELIMGNIVGVQHLLPEYSRYYRSSAKAITFSVFAVIPNDIITMQGFLDDLYQEACEEILLLNREKYDLGDVDEKYITRVASASKVISFKKGRKVCFSDGALALVGQPTKKENKSLVTPQKKAREIFQDSILMVFPKDFCFSFSKEICLGKCIENFCVKIHKEVLGMKSISADLYNLTENRIDQTVLNQTNDSAKLSLSFKRKKVVPENYS
jgi:CPA1 family monovalent cation:H+ antiporter